MKLFKSKFRERVLEDHGKLFEYIRSKHEQTKDHISRLEQQNAILLKGIDAQLNHYQNIRFNILDMLRASKGALVSDLDMIGCKSININVVKSHFDNLIAELEAKTSAESDKGIPEEPQAPVAPCAEQTDSPEHDEAPAG